MKCVLPSLPLVTFSQFIWGFVHQVQCKSVGTSRIGNCSYKPPETTDPYPLAAFTWKRDKWACVSMLAHRLARLGCTTDPFLLSQGIEVILLLVTNTALTRLELGKEDWCKNGNRERKGHSSLDQSFHISCSEGVR